MADVKCARCNIDAYAGEIKIVMDHTEYTYSLCPYCLPIVKARLVYFMESQVAPWATVHSLITDGEVTAQRLVEEDIKPHPKPDFLINKSIITKE